MAFRQPSDFLAPFLQPMSQQTIGGIKFGENVRRADLRRPLIKAQTQKAQLELQKERQAQQIRHQILGGEGNIFNTPQDPDNLLRNDFIRNILGLGAPRETQAQKLDIFQKKEDIKAEGAPKRAAAILKATGGIKTRQAGERAAAVATATAPIQLKAAKESQRVLLPGRIEQARQIEAAVGPARAKNQAEAFVTRLEAQERSRQNRPPTVKEIAEVGLELQDTIFKMTDGYSEDLRPDDMAVVNNKARFYGLKVYPFVNEDTFPDTKTFRVLPNDPSHPDNITKMSEALQFYMQLFGMEEWEARLYLKELDSGS